jgi:hypothetical protein
LNEALRTIKSEDSIDSKSLFILLAKLPLILIKTLFNYW